MNKLASQRKVVVAYIPVLHQGYLKFFKKYQSHELILIGPEIIKDYRYLVKDLRAIDPKIMREVILGRDIFKKVSIARYSDLVSLANSNTQIVMPNEDISLEIQEKYFNKSKIKFDNTFLRWDKHKSFQGQAVDADQQVSVAKFDRQMVKKLRKEAKNSPDWWRQIGAAVIREGKVIMKTHNHAVPSGLLPYSEGDPRANFNKGVHIELSTVLHAEAKLIAEAASKGINLTGAEMYVTTFPCPPCAKLIAYSGIKKLYYADGYGMLDGERILKRRGVKIVFVKN